MNWVTLAAWLILGLIYLKRCNAQGYKNYIRRPSMLEKYHYPGGYTTELSPLINGTDVEVQDREATPDFRIEEPHFTLYHKSGTVEEQRPMRLSPHYKQVNKFPNKDKAWHMGCYCCTVYKRLILLGGCLVVTTRHILTTATATDVVLRNYKTSPNLEGILGAWYDTTISHYNSSMYATPCRIHYHPAYSFDYEVNASNPIPCMYDLSLWAATFRFHGSYMSSSGAVICHRAVSSSSAYEDSIPRLGDLHWIVGFQFMKAYARRPLPWFKYGVKTRWYVLPCPKTEWHWFHCIRGEWAVYGMDSGAGMHFSDLGKTWRIDGVVGLHAFSMHLRSIGLTHYFTVLDTYPVLDFLYYTMLGYQKYTYLDNRFENTKYAAPVLYWGEWIPNDYFYGYEYCDYYPPNYRR